MENFQKLFESFSGMKVGVIGDVMLDTYMFGNVNRISPEAPVPVVVLNEKEYRIGGAGNVALNCHSLGAQVFALSVSGDDKEGLLLEELLNENLIDTTYFLKSTARITTNKTRIISRNQHMMRLDAEMTVDLSIEEEKALLASVRSFIQLQDPDIVIFEDYNKGVLTDHVIQEVITICGEAGVITAVDPKRRNFFSYRHADIFKPNLTEVKQGLNLLIDELTEPLLSRIHVQLQNILEHKISIITLSDKGIFYQQDGKAAIIPAHLRNIADVSGAGDTVVAVAALVYAATQNVHLTAEIANIAGGLVCEEVGTAAIDKLRLQRECELLLS
jgi:D-glycero-beta-D-manno-heptose-7-phosphate kinase